VNPKNKNDRIAHFACHASEKPFFLGYSLTKYQSMNKITDGELSEFLRCDKKSLVKLAICRNPVGSDKSFFKDVKQIAQYVSCDMNQLGRLLRQVESLHSLESQSDISKSNHILLAARDFGNDKSEPLKHDSDNQRQDKDE